MNASMCWTGSYAWPTRRTGRPRSSTTSRGNASRLTIRGSNQNELAALLVAALRLGKHSQRFADGKTARLLTRGKVAKRGKESSDDRLCGNHDEQVLDEPPVVVTRFFFRALEWIGTQIEQLRRAQRDQRLHPYLQPFRLLLHEDRLVLVIAQAGQIAVIGPVEKFVALVWRLAREQIALVVAVKMHLKGLVTYALALQQFVLDVGVAGRANESLHPVFRRDDVVNLGAGFDQTGPSHHRRHAIAALPVGILLAAKWRGAAVGPGEGLGAVVGRVDDDRVVRDPQVVELLQELAHLAVVLDHAVGINTQASLSLRRRFQTSPDMHAAWIEPHEERLLVLVGAVDEVHRGVEKLLVHVLHALHRKRPRVGAALLAPFTEAGIFARSLGRGRRAAQDAARPEAQLEFGILRIVRMLGFIFGIEMVEVAEELVETVNGGQKLVAVAEMVLAELCGNIAERLEQIGQGGILVRQTFLGARQPHFQQSSTHRALAGNECGAAGGA